MSLIDSLNSWYTDEKYPPDGPELDLKWDEDAESWVYDGTTTEQLSRKVIDTSGRWGNRILVVYKRDDELVAVEDMEPATEMQDWGDYGKPDIYPVESYTETVTKYRKKAE